MKFPTLYVQSALQKKAICSKREGGMGGCGYVPQVVTATTITVTSTCCGWNII